MESRLGMPSRTLLLEARDGWWEEETDPGVRGIDQSLANASQLGKGNKLVRALVELLFNDPRSPRSKRTRRPSNLRAIRCYEKRGFERQGTVTTPDGPCTWFKHARHSSEHAVMPNPSIPGGRPRAGALGRPSCQTLDRYDSRPRRSI